MSLMEDSEYGGLAKTAVPLAILVLLLLVLAGVGGYLLRDSQMPGGSSVEVGFARDMSIHHEQAVEMSTLLYERTADPRMRTLAYDIMLTQQGQIGIMSGWLDAWGQSWTAVGPRMAWMGMPMTGPMPGMATAAEMQTLSEAEGAAADIIFLRLMIPHHVSGVAMAQAAADNTGIAPVRQLAQGMAEAQEKEIELMQSLLVDKGAEPLPLDEMDMDGMNMDNEGMSGDG